MAQIGKLTNVKEIVVHPCCEHVASSDLETGRMVVHIVP